MNSNSVIHIVVDMLYDFIEGTLACQNAKEAVKVSVNYINENPGQKVIYVCDSHPSDHCSFAYYGGKWPPHCVAGTKGSEIDSSYIKKITNPQQRPSGANIFKKGEKRDEEQYSGFHAINSDKMSVGGYIRSICKPDETPSVIVSGIATEFCIKESVCDLVREGFKVSLLKEGLGYVNYDNHLQTLKELEDKGVTLI